MKDKTLYWKKAIELIENGNKIKNTTVDFKNEQINWDIAMQFGKNGINVPENLINYDDVNIDYSDIPPSDNLIFSKTAQIVIPVSFDYEIAKWIKNSKVNYNLLINNFLKSVYQSIQTIK